MYWKEGQERLFPIGVLYFRIHTPEESEDAFGRERQCYLINLGILPAYRHLGLGSLLMSWTVEYCVAAGCKRIVLHVQTSNTAATVFYTRKHGFQVLDRVEEYYHRVPVRSAFFLSRSLQPRNK